MILIFLGKLFSSLVRKKADESKYISVRKIGLPRVANIGVIEAIF
jgi:hypothetical protein